MNSEESIKDAEVGGDNVETCEKCKLKTKGNRYTFYYGMSATKTEYYGSRLNTTTRYDDLNEMILYLCDRCVSKAAKTGHIIIAVILFVVAAFFATITIAFLKDDDAPTSFLCIFGAFALFFFFWMIIKILQANKGYFDAEHGETLAMSLRMRELRTNGYNAFLTSQQYSQLKMEIRIK